MHLLYTPVVRWDSIFLDYWFMPFAVIAYAVIAYRIYTRRFRPLEWGLLALLIFHHVLELLQLYVGNGFRINELPNRYFQIVAPLMWGWTACGLVALWRWRKPIWGTLTRLCVVAFALELVGYECVKKLWHEYQKGTTRDCYVAGEKLAPYILADYKGPSRHEDFPYTLNEYYTSRRPVILGDYGRALVAWAVRGQIALPHGPYPFTEDYAVRRVDRYFEELPSDRYEFMAEAMGTRYRWRLYRRKPVEPAHNTTP